MRYHCLLFLVFLLISCKSLDPAIVTSATSTASATTHSHDTVILRNTLYRQDSVIYRERTIHDTVYITKEVYRDRHHSTLNAQHSTIADTIHVVEYRDRVVEHPPERYIPKFHKWCTVLFFALLALVAVCWWLKRQLLFISPFPSGRGRG